MDDINESDCCGNGCANCVLNVKPAKSYKADKSGKQNILGKYTKFRLINKTLYLPQAKNVWKLHFKSKHYNNKDFILDINAGYHLMMRKSITDIDVQKVQENDTEKERKYLLRPYSPYWWDVLEMEFKILVHLIPNGKMSEYIKNLEINDEVEFRGPIGTYKQQPDLKGVRTLLIISQGVAVAPSISIIEEILNNEDDLTRIIHIACFKDLKHVYFREKLYQFSKYWNYKSNIYLSKEFCDNTDCIENLQCLETCENFKCNLKYKESIKPYRFTKKELQNIIEDLKHKKQNIFIAIAGTGTFQNYFKELCQTFNCDFLELYLF